MNYPSMTPVTPAYKVGAARSISSAKTCADMARFHLDGDDKEAAAKNIGYAISKLTQALQLLVECKQ